MEEDNYPKDILHIFAGNALVETHNKLMIAQLDSPITSIEAIDQVPECQKNLSQKFYL